MVYTISIESVWKVQAKPTIVIFPVCIHSLKVTCVVINPVY